MKLRIAFQSKIFFAELESGSQSFMEGTRLEALLMAVMGQIRETIMATSDHEDEIPKRLTMEMDIYVHDQDGKPVKLPHTPRGLFDLMPEGARQKLLKKKGGANNAS